VGTVEKDKGLCTASDATELNSTEQKQFSLVQLNHLLLCIIVFYDVQHNLKIVRRLHMFTQTGDGRHKSMASLH